jgi:hypothetical protein
MFRQQDVDAPQTAGPAALAQLAATLPHRSPAQ